jgi:hypothetical protein
MVCAFLRVRRKPDHPAQLRLLEQSLKYLLDVLNQQSYDGLLASNHVFSLAYNVRQVSTKIISV